MKNKPIIGNLYQVKTELKWTTARLMRLNKQKYWEYDSRFSSDRWDISTAIIHYDDIAMYVGHNNNPGIGIFLVGDRTVEITLNRTEEI